MNRWLLDHAGAVLVTIGVLMLALSVFRLALVYITMFGGRIS